MLKDERLFARALAASFLADMGRARTLVRAIDAGQIDRVGLYNIIMRDLKREVEGKGPALFPQLRGLLRDWITIEASKKEMAHLQAGGMGQFDFASLGSSIVSAVGGYFSAKEQAKTTETLAKYQVQQQALANKALEIDAARAKLALIEKEGGPVEVARKTAAAEAEARAIARGDIPGLGLPWWGLAAGALGVGALVYFAVKAA